MVNAVVPAGEKPATFGWLQFEKKGLQELQKLAIRFPAAMGTLMYMVNRMSRSNALVVSQRAIAEDLGITRESVNRAVKHLVDHNFVQVISGRRKRLRRKRPRGLAGKPWGQVCRFWG